jgi:cysteine-rich repeat protein
MVAALALALAGTSCGHDWSAADGGDSDTASPPDDGDGSGNPDGDAETLPDVLAEDGGGEDAPGETDTTADDTIGPDDAAPDGPPPVCGNGTVESGEQCDDGNASNTDACTNACLVATCGDGYVQADVEACDPGGPASVPGCDSDCTAAACGDGVLGILEGRTDDFESGALAAPPWENGTPYGFLPTPDFAHAGTWGLGSTNAGARRTVAWIRLQAASGGEVCFWYLGEPCSLREDEFRFEVDGSLAFSRRAAQLTWAQQCVPVTPGAHVFEWQYNKGRSDACTGLDAFYIDDVDTGGPFYEECDDGNTSNTDACTGACMAATCGDGYVWDGVEDCEGTSGSCTTSCGSSGSQACSACTLVGGCTPPAEVCNGVDDDCDTVTDDGFACSLGTSRGCTNACGATGTQTCGGACTWGACCAPIEYCDCGVCDDNCNGVIDEGCIPC